MNSLVKLAAIALALLVALVLLDISFSFVSVGINGPGDGQVPGQGTTGNPSVVPENGGQPAGASSGSSQGSSTASSSNQLSGTGAPVPGVPKEVLAPVGLLWWLSGNAGGSPASGSGNATGSGSGDGAIPAGPATGPGTDAGAGTGTGANAGMNPGSPGYTSPDTGDAGISPPGDAGPASLPATSGDGSAGQSAIPGVTTSPGDTILPPGGQSGGNRAASGGSAPISLPDGTQTPGSVTQMSTLTAITDYSTPITKGSAFDVNGTVTAADGTPAAGMTVVVYLARDKTSPDQVECGRAVTVNGFYVVRCQAPDDVTPGDYNLIARSLDSPLYLGSDSDPVVSVVSPTRLTIDAPGNVRSGNGCVVRVTLTESATGMPLGGQPVDVDIGQFSGSGVTDDRGVATVAVDSLPDGTLTLVASYPGQDGYLGSTAQQRISVAPVTLLDIILYVLLALVGLLGLAVIVFMAYSAWENRRSLLYRLWRRPRREQPAETLPVVEDAFVPDPVSPYDISFPEIDELLPAVWGAGDELLVRVTGIPGKPVRLAVDGQILQVVTMGSGEAIVPVVLDKGSHGLSVVPATGSETLAGARIRIVDYREEVVRQFNDLCHRACTRFRAKMVLVTPRELLAEVGPYVPPDSNSHLDSVITIFEVANYSLHGIGRDDYVKSYLSIRELAL